MHKKSVSCHVTTTVGIRKPDMSSFRMVDLGPVFEWCLVFEWFTSLVRIMYKNFLFFIYKMV